VEAKCNAGEFEPPEAIGLTLTHKMFAVFAYILNTGQYSWGGKEITTVVN